VTAQTPAAAHPCECSLYTIDGTWGTECAATTSGRFAVGHDAKLKSLLISAGVAGHQVHRGSEVANAMHWAAGYGFAAKVATGIERGRSRRTAAAAKPDPEPVAARIRVGRWPYAATIAPDGTATYTAGNGEVRTAAPGRYQLVSD
jgi:hypothetical protein